VTATMRSRTLRAAALFCAGAALCGAPAVLADGGGTGAGVPGGGHSPGALAGQGMWIWYVSRSSGGSVAAIAARAHASHVDTVFVKAADDSSEWSQFTPHLVDALHARGLRVCGWQFVYGLHPKREAVAGASAARDGADCLVIDAESSYEGRYAAASVYMRRLRARVGGNYPLALSSFPYVDYHPGEPYSVFLGPGAATTNLPQVYWHTIGTTPGTALAHTYQYNRVYTRSIRPLGQTFDSPPLREINTFRRLSASYGFKGYSWWSWQATSPSEWRALAKPAGRVRGFQKTSFFPALHRGSAGDLVVWAQEHLVGAGARLRVDGRFDRKTAAAVQSFQSARGIPTTGGIGPLTWRALLKVKPVVVNWSHPRRSLNAAEVPRGGEPSSAALPAVRDEVPNRPPPR
jgi:peptidoglycan hydrolase-like protein with peptidoglycan-binding domain